MKCPRGTKEQINANLAYVNKLTGDDLTSDYGGHKPQNGEFECPEEENSLSVYELDVVRADKRCPPTAEDEITYLFVNHFLDILLKSWDGVPCVKPKLAEPSKPADSATPPMEKPENSQNVEKLFEISASNISDLYKSRKMSTNSGQDRVPYECTLSEVCKKRCESRSSAISNCTTSENSSEEETATESEFSWKRVIPDEDVHMSFQNGAWYSGRLSRRLMDGQGTFFWEDGASYTGEFIGGTATGQGKLEYPNLSIYEGSVYNGFRHGEGLHCINESPVMYSGEWWLGKKNGYGTIFYDDPAKSLNFYKGEWVNGVKEGFGYRQYPSGSKYIGSWRNGKRHGQGIMFWCNRDIYRGRWKNGLMDGEGEYIWKGFINKTFCFPKINAYKGSWVNGKRNGMGLLDLSNGSFIQTLWKDNEKNGPGVVICRNGKLIAIGHDNLFKNDKPALISNEEKDMLGLIFRNQEIQSSKKKISRNERSKIPNESQMLAFMSSMEKANAISVPVLTPVQSLDLSIHIKRLQDQKNELFNKQMQDVSIFGFKNTPRIDRLNGKKLFGEQDINKSEEFIATEEKLLRYSVMNNLIRIKEHYEAWTTVACTEKPPFPCLLIRLFFWEMLTQARVPRKNFSLVDIDILLGSEPSLMLDATHNPFERIQLWQFIHFLVTISWHLYGKYVNMENSIFHKNVYQFLEFFYQQNEKAILASGFNYFLKNHIFNPDFHTEKSESTIMRFKNLLPMEATYSFYKNIGEPHSAKQFLEEVLKNTRVNTTDEKKKYFGKLPKHKMMGENVTLMTEVHYLSPDDVLNHPEILPLEEETVETRAMSELTMFAHLGARGIVKCLAQICPLVVEDGLIVDMEYQMTFGEFYKVLIACGETSLKKKALIEIQSEILSNYTKELEEYDRLMKEYEKQKEASLLPGKKSSQFKKPKK